MSSWFANCLYEQLLLCHLETCFRQSNNHHCKNRLKSCALRDEKIPPSPTCLCFWNQPSKLNRNHCCLLTCLFIISMLTFVLFSLWTNFAYQMFYRNPARLDLFCFPPLPLKWIGLSQVCGWGLMASCFAFLLQQQTLAAYFSSDTSGWRTSWLGFLNSQKTSFVSSHPKKGVVCPLSELHCFTNWSEDFQCQSRQSESLLRVVRSVVYAGSY